MESNNKELKNFDLSKYDLQIVQEHFKNVNEFTKILIKSMIPEKHYGKIPGCGDKLNLLQPGAQQIGKLLKLKVKIAYLLINGSKCEFTKNEIVVNTNSDILDSFNIIPVYDPKIYNENLKNGTPNMIIAGINVYDINGHYAGFGLGAASVQKNIGKDEGWRLNQALRMGVKRAFVGGILNVSALSGMFTLDMEDYKFDPENAVIPESKIVPVPIAVKSQTPNHPNYYKHVNHFTGQVEFSRQWSYDLCKKWTEREFNKTEFNAFERRANWNKFLSIWKSFLKANNLGSVNLYTCPEEIQIKFEQHIDKIIKIADQINNVQNNDYVDLEEQMKDIQLTSEEEAEMKKELEEANKQIMENVHNNEGENWNEI